MNNNETEKRADTEWEIHECCGLRFSETFCVFCCVGRWKCCSQHLTLTPQTLFRKSRATSSPDVKPEALYRTKATLYCIICLPLNVCILQTVYLYSISHYCSWNRGVSVKWRTGRPHGADVRRWKRRFVEHLFTHVLLASMEALSHTVYASKEVKINSGR